MHARILTKPLQNTARHKIRYIPCLNGRNGKFGLVDVVDNYKGTKNGKI